MNNTIHFIFFPNEGFLGDKILFEPIIRYFKLLHKHHIIGVEWSADLISMMEFPVSPDMVFVLSESQKYKDIISKFLKWLNYLETLGHLITIFADEASDSKIQNLSSDMNSKPESLWETLIKFKKNSVFPKLEIPNWAKINMTSLANKFSLDLNKNYVTIHIRNLEEDSYKNLEFSKYFEVAKSIVKHLNMKVVFIGKYSGYIFNEDIINTENHIIDFRNKLDSVWDTACLLKKAYAHIGGDSGPTHLAAAVGTRILNVEIEKKVKHDCGPFTESSCLLKLNREESEPNTIIKKLKEFKHGPSSTITENSINSNISKIKINQQSSKYLKEKIQSFNFFTSLSSKPCNSRLVSLYNDMIISNIPNSFFLPLRARSLDKCIPVLRNLPICGFSVSQPFKVDVLNYVDKIHSDVKKIGAANTVINNSGIWKAYNTDWKGIIKCLNTLTALDGKTVIVYGGGGIARAICYALKKSCTKIIVCSRKIEQAKILCSTFELDGYGSNKDTYRINADIFINATPLGSNKNDTPNIFSKLVPKSANVILDVVFEPYLSPLNTFAKSRHCLFISGWDILVEQAIHQIKLFAISKSITKKS